MSPNALLASGAIQETILVCLGVRQDCMVMRVPLKELAMLPWVYLALLPCSSVTIIQDNSLLSVHRLQY